MNAMFGWNNRIKTAVALQQSAGFTPGLDVFQLQNDQGSPSTAWQTSATGAALRIDAGTSVVWRAFGVFRTNLSAAATMEWIVGDNYDPNAGWYWRTGQQPAHVAAGFGQSITTAPADVFGRYLYLDIEDPTNPDGFINVPLLFAGPVWMPQTNISYDSALGRDDMTDETVARGGSEFPVLQYARRRWDVSLAGIRQSELWPQVMDLDAYSRTGGNVLFIPDPAGDVSRETIYGRAKSLQDITYPYGNAERRAWKTRITERL